MEDNLQNVYGQQNNNDFYQSRVNGSMKYSHELPFEQKKESPGIGLEYDSNSTLGYNNAMMNRDLWKPKTVDDLRMRQ